ncbi:hypothetical protein PMAYCL1PPCAC_14529, partial [Pristionchus mayeri]
QMEEERRRARERIDQLKRNLDECKASNTTNILLLFNSSGHQAISIDKAVKRVRASLDTCGEEAKRRCKNNSSLFDCDVCGMNTPNKLVVTTHFLSKGH